MAREIEYIKDRDGSRKADRWTIAFEGAGDRWQTFRYNKPIRKMFVSTSSGVFDVYLGDPGPTQQVRRMQAGDQVNFGKIAFIGLKLVSDSGTAYIHAEWERGDTEWSVSYGWEWG